MVLSKAQKKVMDALINDCIHARSVSEQEYVSAHSDINENIVREWYQKKQNGLMFCGNVNGRTIQALEQKGYLKLLRKLYTSHIVQLNLVKCGIQ